MTPKWRRRILWEGLMTLHVINRLFLFPLRLVNNREYDYNDPYQLLKGDMGLTKTRFRFCGKQTILIQI